MQRTTIRRKSDRNIQHLARMAVAGILLGLTGTPVPAATLNLAWEPTAYRTDETALEYIETYRVYYGSVSGDYTHMVEVGNGPGTSIDNLAEGQTYYFAVTAVDGYGTESSFSEELVWNSLDTDFDQLPDAWEQRMFGGTGISSGDSLDDQDGNGASDMAEYIAGTNPVDASSELAIQMVVEEGRLIISFPATKAEGPGYENKRRLFALERCGEDFNSWRMVEGMPVEGQNQLERIPVESAGGFNAIRLKCWLEALPL